MEDIQVWTFRGVAKMWKIFEAQIQRLEQGFSHQQYVILEGVTEVNFAKVDRAGDKR